VEDAAVSCTRSCLNIVLEIRTPLRCPKVAYLAFARQPSTAAETFLLAVSAVRRRSQTVTRENKKAPTPNKNSDEKSSEFFCFVNDMFSAGKRDIRTFRACEGVARCATDLKWAGNARPYGTCQICGGIVGETIGRLCL
jgi:hypothetical protein